MSSGNVIFVYTPQKLSSHTLLFQNNTYTEYTALRSKINGQIKYNEMKSETESLFTFSFVPYGRLLLLLSYH